MILVDTNVISEPLRKAADPRVVEWIDEQPIETIYLSAITAAELRFGVACLPAGKRRSRLRENIETRVLPRFAGRILVFDLSASKAYADVMTRARAAGVSVGTADGYIAATAAAHRMTVATRETAAFKATGVPVINPWDQTPG